MRIKKKNIRESIDIETEDKLTDVKDTIQQTSDDLGQMGIDDPTDMAADIVSSAVDNAKSDEDSEVSENTEQPTECGMLEVLSKPARPSMTKDELSEAVKSIGKNIEYPRRVIKTFKIKDLRNE